MDSGALAGAALAAVLAAHRVLVENLARCADPEAAEAGRAALLDWLGTGRSEAEIPFAPVRILSSLVIVKIR